jgi:4-carboxymuconolactone decarboxylase
MWTAQPRVRSVAMVGEPEELLRRLTPHEESSVRRVMALNPDPTGDRAALDAALTPRIKMLVRLAALVAVDAPTTSLRWAVERASCAGADEGEIVGVLAIVGSEVGSAQLVSTAPRLALAIGYELEQPRAG